MAIVDYMYSLSLASPDALRLYKLYRRSKTEGRFHLFGYLALEILEHTHLVREKFRTHLHLYLKRVEVVFPVYYQHIIGRRLVYTHEDALYLAWEHIDAADYQHIIGTTARL